MTVDSILKGFTKPLKQLEKLANNLERDAKREAEKVAQLQTGIDHKTAEVEKARAVMLNLSAFLDNLSTPPAKAD